MAACVGTGNESPCDLDQEHSWERRPFSCKASAYKASSHKASGQGVPGQARAVSDASAHDLAVDRDSDVRVGSMPTPLAPMTGEGTETGHARHGSDTSCGSSEDWLGFSKSMELMPGRGAPPYLADLRAMSAPSSHGFACAPPPSNHREWPSRDGQAFRLSPARAPRRSGSRGAGSDGQVCDTAGDAGADLDRDSILRQGGTVPLSAFDGDGGSVGSSDEKREDQVQTDASVSSSTNGQLSQGSQPSPSHSHSHALMAAVEETTLGVSSSWYILYKA